MKKFLLTLTLALACLSTINLAFADGTANIKIRISGAASDNRYFLCLPDVGCLSILGASRGKVFPIDEKVVINTIYVEDADHDFHISQQGRPCNVTVNPNQTVTISGHINGDNNGNAHISGLHCAIS